MPTRNRPTIHERIQRYVDEGKPHKAYDVAVGAVSHRRYDDAHFRWIGRLLLMMDEPARAGTYFLLTQDRGSEANAAINAAVELYGKNLCFALPIHVKESEIPFVVRRLANETLLRAGSVAIGEACKFKPALPSRVKPGGCRDALLLLGCATVVFSTLFFFVMGVSSFFKKP